MAASKAVVGTCFGGTPEAVEDGVTGYVVNPYDTESVSRRIQALVTGPVDATELGNAGRQRLLEHFTAEAMADQYERIYEESRERR
jgi:glycosyltransferase involved in cell wall biosynthesis